MSTLDQNDKRRLEGHILDGVLTDNASGRDAAGHSSLNCCGSPGGDTVVVHSMDRLARNLDDLRALVRGLTHKGGRVEFVKESLVKGKALLWPSSAAPIRRI
ncbi:recombinase family protein [Pseudarthrobacter sp. SLBN-100]